MRVHELDEAYNLSKEDVRTVLVLAGLNTHHLSQVDDEELKSFKIALELFKEDTDKPVPDTATEDEAPAEDEGDVTEALLDFESALAGEPSPILEPALEFPEEDDEMEPIEADLDGDNVLFSEDFDFESTPSRDSFPLCSDRGALTGENVLLPPDIAELVRPILGKNAINSYMLNVDRGHFEFVVYQTAQKHRVRI